MDHNKVVSLTMFIILKMVWFYCYRICFTFKEELEKLNEQVLYYDTDSVIYSCKPGEVKIPTGVFFGQMTVKRFSVNAAFKASYVLIY